mmetsp:Transcript_79538/g.221178  ORF Transcript_79538/g.221178 Transcript_79538/m.221178 type:complete len:332 (+) Transcript_79538:139-1134(+)
MLTRTSRALAVAAGPSLRAVARTAARAYLSTGASPGPNPDPARFGRKDTAAGALFADAGQANAYAAYRPTYPPALYDAIDAFAREAWAKTGAEGGAEPPMRLVFDIGCGTGQATKVLGERYPSARVVGTDVSAAQVAAAGASPPNVEYTVATAEGMDAAEGSVDLVTVAQALHWFQLDVFYAACRRALRPAGVLAVWGYETPVFGQAAADAVLVDLHDNVLGEHWAPGRWHIVNAYADLMPDPRTHPFAEVRRLQGSSSGIVCERAMPMPAIMGYLRSWSAYATLRREHPEREDPLVEVEARFRAALGLAAEDDSTAVRIGFPIFLILMAN